MQTTTTMKLDSLRGILAIRRSALDELARMPAGKHGREWAADRIRDVEWANRQVEREAGRRGMDPLELIELAEMD